MTLNEAMQLITPADHDWLVQLYRTDPDNAATRWIAGVDHYLEDPAAVFAAIKSNIDANVPQP